MKPKPDFLAILQTLAKHQVDFIVVGGVGAVLQGAPISTFDLDVVHSRTSDNIDRLLVANRLNRRCELPGHRRCPSCDIPVPTGARLCPHCGCALGKS